MLLTPDVIVVVSNELWLMVLLAELASLSKWIAAASTGPVRWLNVFPVTTTFGKSPSKPIPCAHEPFRLEMVLFVI